MMAGEKVGLGGTLDLQSGNFVANAQKASQALGRFNNMAKASSGSMGRLGIAMQRSARMMKSGAASISAGASMIGSSMMGAAMGFAPFAIAVGAGFKKAADFEKQMSAVGAITRASTDDLSKLRAEAQKQGVESVFSATQSAQAMEYLARAGADTKQIIDGLGGVMAAAAADGIDLATSADIISQVVKGMGMEFSEAGHVADVLALTSAKANTNITALGESFKYGVSQAKSMGIGVEETAAIFGKLADAGLRGSLGGTAFTNMLIKLGKPTTKGKALLKKWRIELTKSDGSMRKIADIVGDVKKKMDALPTATDKARAASELFGIRGARAYNALATAGVASVHRLEKELVASSFGIGAAAEMAEKRLDNFLGAWTLFMSSMESVALEFFGPLMGTFKEMTQDLTGSLNKVLFSVQGLRKIENAAEVASVGFAKAEAARYAKKFQFSKRMEERAGILAEATVQALTTQAVGEEKLTRAQRKARATSFEQFVELGLLRTKMSRKARDAEMEHVRDVIKAGLSANASEKQRVSLQLRMMEAIASQQKGWKKLTRRQQENRIVNMALAADQRAAAAARDTAARAFLVRQKQLNEIEAEQGPIARTVAEGFMEAIDTIKSSIQGAIKWIKQLGARIEAAVGRERLKQFVKFATIGVIVAAAIAPLAAGFALFLVAVKAVIGPIIGFGKMIFGIGKILWAFGGIIKALAIAAWPLLKAGAIAALGAIKAALGAVIAAAWPIALVVGALVVAFMIFRKEGESVGDTFRRLWSYIQAGALWVYNTAILPFIEGFKTGFASSLESIKGTFLSMWETIKQFGADIWAIFSEVWTEVGGMFNDFSNLFYEIFGDLFGISQDTTNGMAGGFRSFGEVVGMVWGTIANLYTQYMAGMLKLVLGVVKTLVKVLIIPFRTMVSVVRNVVQGVLMMFRGDFLGGLGKIATAMKDTLAWPFRMLLQAVLGIVDALPKDLVGRVISDDKLKKLEQFAKYGFAGPPKQVKQSVQTATAGMADVIQLEDRRKKKRRGKGLRGAGAMLAPSLPATMTGEDQDRNRAILAAIEGLGPKAKRAKLTERLEEAGIDPTKENRQRARAILRQQAAMKREERADRRAAAKKKEIQAKIGIEDKRQLNIQNKMCVEGESLSVASANHKQSIYERNGGKSTPYIRRRAAESGVRPTAEARA